MQTPSFIEDHISQIPALQMLMKLGWQYLSPAQALEARGGREANVLLEDILEKQLQQINKIEYKGKEFLFSDANIAQAVLAIRDLPEQDGFIAANKYFYELITLGKSFDQNVLGDRKSFSLKYMDWKHPENNVFHVTEEFSVLRSGRTDHYRPDIVLFINGIPMVVIECKSPKIKNPVNKAIEQHIRNQQEEGIRTLYQYSNLTMALATNDSKYGTTATTKEFWGFWKELFHTKETQRLWENDIYEIKHRELPDDERTVLFRERFKNVLDYFNRLERKDQVITSQDKMLYSLCRPERLFDLMYDYIVYDDGVKKIARYQQYFAIRMALARILAQTSSDSSQREEEQGVSYRANFNFSGLLKEARVLRQRQTPSEELLWDLLRNKKLNGLKFRRQHQIGHYIVDFYCHKLKLIVELDGSVHDTPERQKKDQTREKYLHSLGFKILRFRNEDVFNNTEEVLNKIISAEPSPSGRGQGEGPGEGNARHPGGVIWHTQGSGKSLTMVMLAEQIAAHPKIKNPKIILVTDRIDLDSQITDTFKKCHIPVENADTGSSKEIIKKLHGQTLSDEEEKRLKKDRSLLKLLSEPGNGVITTIIHKFEAAVKASVVPFDSTEIFVLVDEGHRSQYGTFNTQMQKIFPNACFIAFTGTPLMKKEKSTARKFGGIIDVYSIADAVADGAVVPLLYEGRHNLIEVNEKPLDSYFEKVSEPLTDYGKASLKRKYSSKNAINKADQVIYARTWDISEHYVKNFQHTGFKGQMVTPNKATAIKYKEYFDKIGKVNSEVLISAPDMREGEEDAFDPSDDKVKKFWKSRMDKYGSAKKYEESVIGAFKKQEQPEIIIVVDKLLTGFDAPRNTVLYIACSLKEHRLLQAIARVNRVYPGKDYGYIIDYYGNLENLDEALKTYTNNTFDEEDLEGSWINIEEEIKKLPQAHSELWDIFKTIKNKYDEPAYEELLFDEAIRHLFYEKVSVYSRLLKMALSSVAFYNNTPEKQIDKYKADAKFFLALRVSVKRRYSDDIDYKEFEPQVQKLIDQHISTDGDALKITELVNIFDQEKREAEVEKVTGKAAKADHITSRTIRAIHVKMNEDPVFYKKLSLLIRETIDAYRQQRINEAEYLKRAKTHEESFLKGYAGNVPDALKDNESGIAIYNLVTDIFEDKLKGKPEVATQLAIGIDKVIRSIIYDQGRLLVDWQNNPDIDGKIKIAVDDFIFDLKANSLLNLPFDDIDQTINEALKIAKLKFTS